MGDVYNYIRLLTDDLLREILCRLPSCEMAVQCKCVCKHWLDLISCPYFSSCFMAFKKKKNSLEVNRCSRRSKRRRLNSGSISKKEERTPSAFILCSNKPQETLVLPEDSAFRSHKFSLSFLPSSSEDIRVAVLPSSSDLLFSWNLKNVNGEGRALYICNPRTKQWIQLPTPAKFEFPTEKVEAFIRHGFISDPYYSFDGRRGSVALDASFRFLVCIVYMPPREYFTQLTARIFSSRTGQWRNCVLVSPKILRDVHMHMNMHAVAHNGMLHFLCLNGILAFDPYEISHDGIIHSRIIDLPRSEPHPFGVLGVCRGNLRMVQCNSRITLDRDLLFKVKIWDLVDYRNSRWKQRCKFSFGELTADDLFTQELLKERLLYIVRVEGIHPYDGDILVLRCIEHVVLCNTRTKKLVSAISLPRRCNLYSIVLPWWPTPVPKIPADCTSLK